MKLRLSLLFGLLIFSVFLSINDACFASEYRNTDNVQSNIRDAIVKIYTVFSDPDYFSPWKMENPGNITASGCIIDGHKILTNAHVVANHRFIQVRKNGNPKKYIGQVLAVSHEADLALLTVSDKEFFSDTPKLDFGPLPQIKQDVLVYGFPDGGDSLSITKGVLSRIENQVYSHSSHIFLSGQVDAAINPGNSGGPVVVDTKIVGVVMQTGAILENINYMVPNPVIKHFLSDIKDGKYDGFPDCGLVCQNLENPHMKRMIGLPQKRTGIYVVHVFLDSPATGIIQPGDVLLEVDGRPIADDGTVEFRFHERTNYAHFIQMKQIGDSVNINIFRRGKVKKVSILLTKTSSEYMLVPLEQYDQSPLYFIYAGFVFTPLTTNLLKQWGINWTFEAPQNLLYELSNWPNQEKREVVVAIQVLASKINKGYENFFNWIVTEVNGKKFKDFTEFFHLIQSSSGSHMVFTDEKGFKVVIDRKVAQKTHRGILKRYNIADDRSADLN